MSSAQFCLNLVCFLILTLMKISKLILMEVINIPNVGGMDKYLGLPFLVGKARVKDFTIICEIVKKRIDT